MLIENYLILKKGNRQADKGKQMVITYCYTVKFPTHSELPAEDKVEHIYIYELLIFHIILDIIWQGKVVNRCLCR